MKEPPNKQFKPSRLVALTITTLVGGAAIHDQLIDGQMSTGMLGALLALVLIWLGIRADGALNRWFGE